MNDINPDLDQYHRRFAGTQRLYGTDTFARFAQAHVIVIGVGGVGSWAAEGLVRTGIGQITLIDLDVLVASNVNRQLPALDSTFGQSKITAMAQRLEQINPKLNLKLIDDFLTPDNVTQLLPSKQSQQGSQPNQSSQYNQSHQTRQPLVVLDCVDDINAKVAIALHCRFNKLKLICAGGAGGKTDASKISVSDLKHSQQDPLLAKLRQKLRHEHNINKNLQNNFGIKCVYSTQPPIGNKPQASGLRCGGYGSAVVVTSVVGMVMVSEALRIIDKM